MKRTLIVATALVIWMSNSAYSQGFSRQVVAEIVAATGVSRAEAQRQYAYALRGMANTFAEHIVPRARQHGAYAFNSRFARDAGRHLLELPGMRQWFRRYVMSVVTMPNASPKYIQDVLTSSSTRLSAILRPVVQQNVHVRNFAANVLAAAERLTGMNCVLACSIKAVLRAEATQGGKSALARIASSVGARFGTFLEWLSSHTAQRILGIYTIADFTQQQINKALHAFQDEMEAIGDASEAEAYNNNLQLMLDRLKDGRLVLVPGMTLDKAVRQLRRNMNKGGKYFAGIVTKPKIGGDGQPHKAVSSCAGILGSWGWPKGIATFSGGPSGGRASAVGNPNVSAGTWSCIGPGRIRINWHNGKYTDTMTLSGDTLSGSNQNGYKFSAARSRQPASAGGETCKWRPGTTVYAGGCICTNAQGVTYTATHARCGH